MNIKVNLNRQINESYDVLIGEGILKKLHKPLMTVGHFSNYVIITDSVVKKLYGNNLCQQLNRLGLKTILISFKAGEKSKTQKTKTFLETRMLKKGCTRDTLVIALGGGVVGDMAGFVAATFMRGVPYVQIPTTLLAMVDSSLGGKTGIDTPLGKNLIGAFWQPKKIFIDLECIAHLPTFQILNGYYEIVKMAITSNTRLFDYAEKNLAGVKSKNPKVLRHLITESLKIKARVVEKDERESDNRMILNFGHTVGHALEALSGYKLAHGEAVALGVIAEAKISFLGGLLPIVSFRRIESLLEKSGIDKLILHKWTAKQIITAARKDKKTSGGRLRVVLIQGIGRLHRRDGMAASFVSDEIIKKALTIPRT